MEQRKLKLKSYDLDITSPIEGRGKLGKKL